MTASMIKDEEMPDWLTALNWGSLADWASAGGSVFAAVVALALAKEVGRVKIQATCGVRTIVGAEINPTTLASIIVINVGERPFKICAIGLSHGLLKKTHGIIKIGAPTEFCDQLLRTLNDGEQSHFGFLLESNSNWVAHQGRNFKNWIDLMTFRVTIHCTNGQSLRLKPEKQLRDEIAKRMKANKKLRNRTDRQ